MLTNHERLKVSEIIILDFYQPLHKCLMLVIYKPSNQK